MLARRAKSSLLIPAGVIVNIDGSTVSISGKLGMLSYTFNNVVKFEINDDKLNVMINEKIKADSKFVKSMSGTAWALLNNMINGVCNGFEKKLIISGVGYRASLQGRVLNLLLGYSHPVVYTLPEGISATLPVPTEIVLTGLDKQFVGQCAACIKAYRAVEPYKNKGIRYADEVVRKKETKKK